jgi:ZIP family zinc transporter
VSIPIFYATGNRRKAFLYSFASGIFEPIGAVIGAAFLLPFMTDYLLGCVLAFVAGIMVYIIFDELLPAAHKYGRAHSSHRNYFWNGCNDIKFNHAQVKHYDKNKEFVHKNT